MTKYLRLFLLPAAAAGMLGFAVYHLIFAHEALRHLAPASEPPRSAYAEKVVGSGLVEPRGESIAVGSAQSGLVVEVFHTSDKVGARVAAGEPLFRIDDRQLQAQLLVHQANLKVAEAALDKLRQMPRPEDLPPLAAKVRMAQANLAQVKDRYDWVAQLKQNVTSREEISQRKLAVEIAQGDVEQAEAQYAREKAGAWAPDLARAEADVAVARTNVAQVQTEIDRSLVRAPAAGELLQVNVRLGEYVSGASGKALVVLGDLSQLRVRVDIDEQDIARFRSGARAIALARGDAHTELPLTFVRVEPYVVPKKTLTGDNAERVDTRVLQVIYQLDQSAQPDPSRPTVFVGQQLDVFVELETGKR